MPAWKAASSAGSMLVIARYARLRGILANRIERLGQFAKTCAKSIRACCTFCKPTCSTPARLVSGARSDSAGDEQRVPLDGIDLEHPLQRGHAPRAELRSRPVPQLDQSLVLGQRLPVGPGGEHRVERVGDMDDACSERDLLPGQPVRIPLAVEALVVVPDRRNRV